MNPLIDDPKAVRVETDERMLTVHLADGRILSVPLNWYPRLAKGTRQQRTKWELIAGGYGIHWPELDEDISVEGLLKGVPSPEFRRSHSTKRKRAA